MEMHGAGGLAQIAVAAKEPLQGLDQGPIVTGIMFKERASVSW